MEVLSLLTDRGGRTTASVTSDKRRAALTFLGASEGGNLESFLFLRRGEGESTTERKEPSRSISRFAVGSELGAGGGLWNLFQKRERGGRRGSRLLRVFAEGEEREDTNPLP